MDALAAMPDDVIDDDERHAFTLAESVEAPALAGQHIGLALPWAEGQSWFMGGGPHGDDGRSRPFNSIDFNGGGSVQAAADGRIYTTCARFGSALRTIVHTNGYSTSYYHMVNLPPFANGAAITKGTAIGTIGNGLPCGGSSTGAHVHFALKKGEQKIAVNNNVIGGWTFFEGPETYQGKAVRGPATVFPGRGVLRNFGDSDKGL